MVGPHIGTRQYQSGLAQLMPGNAVAKLIPLLAQIFCYKKAPVEWFRRK